MCARELSGSSAREICGCAVMSAYAAERHYCGRESDIESLVCEQLHCAALFLLEVDPLSLVSFEEVRACQTQTRAQQTRTAPQQQTRELFVQI
jgi:hypothetical protein